MFNELFLFCSSFVMIASLLCNTDVQALIQMVEGDIHGLSVGQYAPACMYFSINSDVSSFTNYSKVIMTSIIFIFFFIFIIPAHSCIFCYVIKYYISDGYKST